VNALLAGVIGVAATLLGSFSTYRFQQRTAERAEAFAREERLHQEQMVACSAYAGTLTELKRGLVTLWFHREDHASAAWQATRIECDRLGANAESARFRVQLVSGDSELMVLADSAFSSIDGIHAASDRNELIRAEERFESAVKEFITAAGIRLRMTG
jgi:hypothetical protein